MQRSTPVSNALKPEKRNSCNAATVRKPATSGARAQNANGRASAFNISYMRKAALALGSAAFGAGVGLALFRTSRKADLSGQVVLITGGSRGLGLALAREFGSRGAELILCARNSDELERARHDLSNIRGKVLTIPCDVTDPAQVSACIAEGVSTLGRIDILVNNAGTISVGPLHTMAIEDFEQAIEVMFWGVIYTTMAILPHFRQRGSGRIVNITSIGGKVSVPHLLPYSCAKFAATAFSEGLSAELRGSGIRVLTIAPGLMRTGSFVERLFQGRRKRGSRVVRSLLQPPRHHHQRQTRSQADRRVH